jgi:hypothetical protein
VHIGDFGAAQHELTGEQDEFGFFGETFHVVGAIPAVLMLQLGAAATGKIDESEGFAAMYEALRCSLTKPASTADDGSEIPADDSQFTKIYKLAVEKNCELESLMRLVFTLFEVQGGRPTQPVPASLPGRSPTSPSSNSSATHPALSHLRSVDEIVTGNVIRMGDGDLVEVDYDKRPPTEQTG